MTSATTNLLYQVLQQMCTEPAWQVPDDDASWLAEARKRLPGHAVALADIHEAQRQLIADGHMRYVGNKGVMGMGR